MDEATENNDGKMEVVKFLYKEFSENNTPINEMIVINERLVEVIKSHGNGLSSNNPANFLKDILRSDGRNERWPKSLRDLKITARQKYRKGKVFAFDKYGADQDEPFPDICILPEDATHHEIESVSLPSSARALGRKDEAWLIQVCVHQRLVQTHFGLHSPLRDKAIDLFHLQNSVKTTPEIDAIFLLSLRGMGKALVTLEAKRNEPVLMDQIRAQAAQMAKTCSKSKALSDVKWIIPLAAKSQMHAGQRVVGLFEMEPIDVKTGAEAYAADQEHLLDLNIRKSVAYRFSPTVSGI